jgi:hypothetical protein
MFARLALVPLLLAVAVAIAAGGALGNGGPSPGAVTGWDGVLAPGGKVRYVALWARGPQTPVAAVRVDGGRVLRATVLLGAYGVPLVAYDGTTGGISRDGKTLVLSTWGSKAATRFAVLSTAPLRVRNVVSLRGSWSYDALSPDGSTLFLIEYLAEGAGARYRVRAYDLAGRRLLPGTISDRREPGPMQGMPLARTTSGDGRWAYTLYGKSGGGEPFVHALDTVRRAAVCIDLPWRASEAAMSRVRMGLSRGGSALLLWQPEVGTLATVDLRSFRVQAVRKPVVRR